MNPATQLFPDQYYHIFNRGNNRENIFIEERNYSFFLSLYARFIEPIAETYAYCLLRNHFHFLIKIRQADDITGSNSANTSPNQSFSNFFNAYARTINQTYGRSGALFERPYKRILVHSNQHLIGLVKYIHMNPEKHGFVHNYRDWPYSSSRAIISDKYTRLNKAEVISWFDGSNGFQKAHNKEAPLNEIRYLISEDDQ
jgi:REP element-mobilizing transposase RayT